MGIDSEPDDQVDFTLCVLEPGDLNTIVEEGEWCTIEITKLFDTSILKSLGFDLDNLLGFILNKNDTPTSIRLRLGYFNTFLNQIIHKSIYKMKLNERSHLSFEVNPHLLDESLAISDKHHLKEVIFLDLKFDIRLTNVEKLKSYETCIYKLTEDQLYNLSMEHKLDANEIFKKNHIRTAFQRYRKAISYLIIADQIIKEKIAQKEDEMSENNEVEIADRLNELKKRINDQRALLYSNLAMCQLKNGNYDMAVINTTKCLEIDSKNVKALFRRAQARTGRNDFDEALEDYKRALNLDPNNQDIKNRIHHVETLKKTYTQAISKNLKKFFS
ncbi:unnamed protein product [Brachionus calyciflorus]|uniref:Uncharacterized protein n=1 Tax=Brachionus calyciflorus TaxID=104777 RepID=A0A813M2M1_9BILA|nr:unnamed protein product [Brachionus calyciflorus]